MIRFARVTDYEAGGTYVIIKREWFDANDYASVEYPLWQKDLTNDEVIAAVCNELDNDAENDNYHGLVGQHTKLTDDVSDLAGVSVAADFAIRLYERGGLLR